MLANVTLTIITINNQLDAANFIPRQKETCTCLRTPPKQWRDIIASHSVCCNKRIKALIGPYKGVLHVESFAKFFWHYVWNVVPRMAIQSLLQSLLIQIVTCHTATAMPQLIRLQMIFYYNKPAMYIEQHNLHNTY